MRQSGSTQNRIGRDWLTLAQKQHSRPRERVGQEAAASLWPSLSPWQVPDIQVVTSQPLLRVGSREETVLTKENEQGGGVAISIETFGGGRTEPYDRR